MDKRIYERLFTTPAYLVLNKAEELCNKCKYEKITPLLLFVSMLIAEKEYMIKKLSEVELEYSNVCTDVEEQISTLPRQTLEQYNFSDETLNIVCKAILNKKHKYVTLFDLLSELTTQSDISDLLRNKVFEESDIDEQKTGELVFDPITGSFQTENISYYDDATATIDGCLLSGYVGEGFAL